jgi:hypothetical protein
MSVWLIVLAASQCAGISSKRYRIRTSRVKRLSDKVGLITADQQGPRLTEAFSR